MSRVFQFPENFVQIALKLVGVVSVVQNCGEFNVPLVQQILAGTVLFDDDERLVGMPQLNRIEEGIKLFGANLYVPLDSDFGGGAIPINGLHGVCWTTDAPKSEEGGDCFAFRRCRVERQ